MYFDMKFIRRDWKTCRNGEALPSHSALSDQAMSKRHEHGILYLYKPCKVLGNIELLLLSKEVSFSVGYLKKVILSTANLPQQKVMTKKNNVQQTFRFNT